MAVPGEVMKPLKPLVGTEQDSFVLVPESGLYKPDKAKAEVTLWNLLTAFRKEWTEHLEPLAWTYPIAAGCFGA